MLSENDRYEELLNAFISEIEKNTCFRIPRECQKNAHTKACWLIYIRQKALMYFDKINTKDSNIENFVVTLRQILPTLKQLTEQKRNMINT